MSMQQILMMYRNPVISSEPNLDGLKFTNITLPKQNPSSISEGFMINSDGTFYSRSYPTYAYSVPISSLDTGKWRDNTHTGTGFYEMRLSLVSGSAGSFACTKYGNYPMNGDFGVTWFDPNTGCEFYGNTAHSPVFQFNEVIRIEVRYTSNSVMISNTTVTFSS